MPDGPSELRPLIDRQAMQAELDRRANIIEILRMQSHNIESAARALDAMFTGKPGAWTLDCRKLTDQAADALLVLHDYLNDAERERGE